MVVVTTVGTAAYAVGAVLRINETCGSGRVAWDGLALWVSSPDLKPQDFLQRAMRQLA